MRSPLLAAAIDILQSRQRGVGGFAIGHHHVQITVAIEIGEPAEVGGFRRITLQGGYKVQRVGMGDLDGDGKLDFLVKHPDFNSDPNVSGKGFWKPSPEPYKLEAYRHDGSFLWRYDMGPGIETGIWYSPVLVYDIDGDGKAEVYCKAGPVDPAKVVRVRDGMVIGGPEFLVKLDGATGQELARIDWPINREGFTHLRVRGELGDYAMFSRNLLGVAYLDGRRPHLIVQRGSTYSATKISAYDPELKLVWRFESKGEYASYSGQATHGMQIADVDNDGRDEIIFGAAAIDDDGTPLWSTARGHPDVCHVGRINPELPGMQVFYGHEWWQKRDGVCLVDALTGKTLAIADCIGDWREELVVSLPGEIRIYSTTIPATSRRVCLMQDRQYRTSVARQTMGYFYPPILGLPL